MSTVNVTRAPWDKTILATVTLAPVEGRKDIWTVTMDGTVIGTVEKYRASLNIKLAGTRLRRLTAERTFWQGVDATGDPTLRLRETRAEVLRTLIERAGQ